MKNVHKVTKPSSVSSTVTSKSSSSPSLDHNRSFTSSTSLLLTTEETTNSSVSSYHSTSDISSLLESPKKTDLPLDTSSVFSNSSDNHGEEATATLTLDEVMQFAQPIVTDYY